MYKKLLERQERAAKEMQLRFEEEKQKLAQGRLNEQLESFVRDTLMVRVKDQIESLVAKSQETISMQSES